MARSAAQGPAWAGSDRASRLPANWRAIRRHVLLRDQFRCTANDDGARCRQPATDVDHINRGDNHHPTNLTSLCADHHRAKTAAEGNAARRRPKTARAVEPHPGIADGGKVA